MHPHVPINSFNKYKLQISLLLLHADSPPHFPDILDYFKANPRHHTILSVNNEVCISKKLKTHFEELIISSISGPHLFFNKKPKCHQIYGISPQCEHGVRDERAMG